jgi:diacylglycerol kinase family enzyme
MTPCSCLTLTAIDRLDRVLHVRMIHNPTAGGSRAEKVVVLAATLRIAGVAVMVVATKAIGDAERFARPQQRAGGRSDMVMAIGS